MDNLDKFRIELKTIWPYKKEPSLLSLETMYANCL